MVTRTQPTQPTPHRHHKHTSLRENSYQVYHPKRSSSKRSSSRSWSHANCTMLHTLTCEPQLMRALTARTQSNLTECPAANQAATGPARGVACTPASYSLLLICAASSSSSRLCPDRELTTALCSRAHAAALSPAASSTTTLCSTSCRPYAARICVTSSSH